MQLYPCMHMNMCTHACEPVHKYKPIVMCNNNFAIITMLIKNQYNLHLSI